MSEWNNNWLKNYKIRLQVRIPSNSDLLTILAGPLEVWDNPQDVVHQVGTLLVLQNAACGGVGRVYVGEIGQIHAYKENTQEERGQFTVICQQLLSLLVNGPFVHVFHGFTCWTSKNDFMTVEDLSDTHAQLCRINSGRRWRLSRMEKTDQFWLHSHRPG